MQANMEKVIKEYEKYLTTYYDMTCAQLIDIHDNSNGVFEMIGKAFKFGFGQGMKCQKSIIKKGRVKN